MYNAQELTNRIKAVAKSNGISLKEMLPSLNLGINALQHVSDKGIASFSLAKIADYLDCSTDYLLGRTDDPQSHKHSQPAVLVDNQPRFLIRRAGRDGSFVEEYVTKEDLERLHALPDAKDI